MIMKSLNNSSKYRAIEPKYLNDVREAPQLLTCEVFPNTRSGQREENKYSDINGRS